jgi:hypothetical protein
VTTSCRAASLWALAPLAAAPLLAGCVALDFALFPSEEASLDDFDFASPALDGIDPSRITSELVEVGDGSGERIHVIFVERDASRLDPRLDPDAGVTVVFSHGNYRNMLHYWHRVGYYEQLGFHVLIYDYRGYGASDGSTSEATLAADAEAAYDYAASRDGVGRILSLGYSMGGTAATHLCAPESGRAVIGCFTEAIWADAQGLVDASTGIDLPASFFTDGAYDNLDRVGRFEVPIAILHGTSDGTVAFENGRRLWATARGRHLLNRFFVVEGGAHSNLPVPSEPEEPTQWSYPDEMPAAERALLLEYQSRIVDFVADVLAP